VDTLLHFTSKTEEVKKKGTNVSTPVMQYLTRRVKEARYLADGLTDPEQQQRARALIKAREDEWLAARGEAIK
jgi:predicted metal-dependent peptidase